MAALASNAILGTARLLNVAYDRAQQLVQDRTLANQLPIAPNGNVWNFGWVGLTGVGQGGYGICALFGRFDGHGVLQERMVVKETWCNGLTWHDPVQWQGAYDAQGHRDYCDRIRHLDHMENVIHRNLSGQKPATIVRFLGSSVPHPFRWNFRTYLEYCPYNSLQDVISFYSYPDNFEDDTGPEEEEHEEEEEFEDHTMDESNGDDDIYPDRRVNRIRRRLIDIIIPAPSLSEGSSGDDSSISHSSRPETEGSGDSETDEAPEVHHLIPEPFLWYTFDCLAQAAQVMQRGHAQRRGEHGWRQIVHRDIKPGNVFLQDPPPGARDDWKLYPKPVLADFGLGIETTATDPNNPRAYREMGSNGFIAPEQQVWVNRTNRNVLDNIEVSGVNVFRLDAHTNIWQIGMVMYCLMHRIQDADQVLYVSDADMLAGGGAPQLRRGRARAPDADMAGSPRREPYRKAIPAPGYSPTLVDLVHQCLSMYPTERPTADAIRALVAPGRGLVSDGDLLGGMRRMRPRTGQAWHDNERGRQHRLRMWFGDDYRLGLSRDAFA